MRKAVSTRSLKHIVVMTDGLENSSTEFTKAQIKEMIQRQQVVYRWQFNFLGANQDAFAEAEGMGIHPAGVAVYADTHVTAAYSAANCNVARMRGQRRRGEPLENAFTDRERAEMK